MNLSELVEEICMISERIDDNSVDYENLGAIYSVLNKLVEKYIERCKDSDEQTLNDASWHIPFKLGEVKKKKTKEILEYLYSVTIKTLRSSRISTKEASEDVIML